MRPDRRGSIRASALLATCALATIPGIARTQTRPAPSAPAAPSGAAATPATVPSDAVREAHERFERGIALSDEGNFDAAMVEFQRAYAITHNPVVLFNIAVTHEAMGHYVEALDALQQYVREVPPDVLARNRAVADATLARLQTRIGRIVVQGADAHATLTVDGLERPLADAAQGLRVSAGRHRIVLRAAGFVPLEREVDVAGGTEARVAGTLERIQTAVAITCNVPDAEVVIDGVVVGRTPAQDPFRVSEGQHTVELRRPGYTSYSTVVNASGPGSQVEATLAWMDPIPPGVAARLTLDIQPPGAVVSVDGRRFAAEGADAVPPGAHRLQISRAEYTTIQRDLTLAPSSSSSYLVRMQPSAAARHGQVVLRRVAGGVVLGVGVAALAGGLGWYLYNDAQLRSDRATLAGIFPNGLSCTAAGTAAQAAECANLTYTNAIAAEQDYQIASGIVMGIGGAALVAGIVTLATAGLADPGERPPVFQLRGGLGSVDLTYRF